MMRDESGALLEKWEKKFANRETWEQYLKKYYDAKAVINGLKGKKAILNIAKVLRTWIKYGQKSRWEASRSYTVFVATPGFRLSNGKSTVMEIVTSNGYDK